MLVHTHQRVKEFSQRRVSSEAADLTQLVARQTMIMLAERRTPSVTVDDNNHKRLTALADASYALDPELAEMLLDELSRAKIVEVLPEGIVGIGNTVKFRDFDTKREQIIQLVYPIEANIENRKISVFTPIGVALLGLQIGGTISFLGKEGRMRTVQVMDVLRSDD